MQEKILKTIEILKEIRANCPADRVRNEDMLIKNIKDELDEVSIALKIKDYENLAEELGDLLFTVLFLSNLCEEKYNFDMEKILSKLNNKMIFRHPHVFEDKREVSIEEAENIWEKRKKQEKELKIIH